MKTEKIADLGQKVELRRWTRGELIVRCLLGGCGSGRRIHRVESEQEGRQWAEWHQRDDYHMRVWAAREVRRCAPADRPQRMRAGGVVQHSSGRWERLTRCRYCGKLVGNLGWHVISQHTETAEAKVLLALERMKVRPGG